MGSNGDSDDNALAETINGLYKSEVIQRRAHTKTREAVEFGHTVMGAVVQQPSPA